MNAVLQSTTNDVKAVQAVPAEALLEVLNLQVEFRSSRGVLRAVDGVSWSVAPGEVVALVGESGCGKSVTALSILGLLGKPAGRIVGGSINFEGRDLAALPDHEMRKLRGSAISMIFQEPMTSLNPVLTIGQQVAEPLIEHLGMTRMQAHLRSIELLNEVGISDAERRLAQYPHHLSGGMRQRVMIAMGLACRPKLIIADEPTTALDVTIQAQILELMRDLARKLNIALVIITHNLGIVARYADRVNVMYAGRIVESGPVDAMFAKPNHPYTLGLLRAVPRLDEARRGLLPTIEGLPPNLAALPPGCRFAPRCEFRQDLCHIDPPLDFFGAGRQVACHFAEEVSRSALAAPAGSAPSGPELAPAGPPLLEVSHAHMEFAVGNKGVVRAVQDVSLFVRAGETLGVVGESGCGKTTLGRMVLRLIDPTSGSISYRGALIADAKGAALRAYRREMQVVFQDPYSSLNPRMSVGQIIEEPLKVHGIVPRASLKSRVAQLLEQTGLPAAMADRYPHQLSGGQRQRVGIARALALQPSFIVLDEPVSALDVSVQGQIVNLLSGLQSSLGIGYLFIAHDLAVVRHLSHRVMVMYLGRVMETASRDALYETPLHPYTIALLNSAPIPDPVIERRLPRAPLGGEIPSPLAPPPGCVFNTRCPRASIECTQLVPPLREARPGRFVACIKV